MKNMAEIHQLRPRAALTAWMCSACGVDAACNCGAPLMSKAQRAAEAIAVNPHKSDRAIAEEIGVSAPTVGKARRDATVNNFTVDENEPRVGLDGKQRRMPQREVIQEACADCDTEEDFWQRSLGNMAGDAVALADQWTQQFGDWQRFEVTSDLVVLARQASDAWGNLAKIMETKL